MTDKIVRLYSSEEEAFEVTVSTASLSEMIKTMIDEDEDDEVQEIILPNVSSRSLARTVEFMRHHAVEPMTEISTPLKSNSMKDEVQEWYTDFVDVDQEFLFELILAANYLDIKPLLELACATVVSMVKSKNREELKETFKITHEFTAEEEAKIRADNKWCESV
jgi:S-phase kinase-associated protein 1